MGANKWDILAALPFLAAAGGLLYVAIVAAGGAIRLRRRQQRRRQDEAMRRATGVTPWSLWLDEINQLTEKARDRADR